MKPTAEDEVKAERVLSNATKQHYLTTYLNLIKRFGTKNPTKLATSIDASTLKPNTKLSMLNSIIGTKALDSSLVRGDMSRVEAIRNRLDTARKEALVVNNLNENQSSVMSRVSENDLINMVEKMNQVKNESTKNLEDYIVMRLMTQFQPRNDLQEIRIVRNQTDLTKWPNVIYLSARKAPPNKSYILIREHKTGRLGPIEFKLDDDLTTDIKRLVRDRRNYLFISRNGEPLSTSNFTNWIKAITQKNLGTPLSSTLIRKIYYSNKYSDILEDLTNDAKRHGHSVKVASDHYIKRGTSVPP
jgi:hypothetical protein